MSLSTALCSSDLEFTLLQEGVPRLGGCRRKVGAQRAREQFERGIYLTRRDFFTGPQERDPGDDRIRLEEVSGAGHLPAQKTPASGWRRRSLRASRGPNHLPYSSLFISAFRAARLKQFGQIDRFDEHNDRIDD